MEASFDNLNQLLSLDERRLFNVFGDQLLSGRMFAAEPSNDEAEEKGRSWFDANRDKLCELLREERRFERFRDSTNNDLVQFALYLADFLSAHFILIPPFTLAVICIRAGVDGICEDSA